MKRSPQGVNDEQKSSDAAVLVRLACVAHGRALPRKVLLASVLARGPSRTTRPSSFYFRL